MRDNVPVMVAGLQVFTSLNMTGKRGETKQKDGEAAEEQGGGGAHAGVSAVGASKVRGKGTFGRKEKNGEGFKELVSNRGQLADRLVQQEQRDLN